MAKKYKNNKDLLIRRHKRIRKKIKGDAECPRLCVNFTAKHIYTQLIDDRTQVTLTSMSSMDKEFKEEGGKSNLSGAEIIGKKLADKISALGLKSLVFDRGGFKYHGRVKAIADAVRKSGLEF